MHEHITLNLSYSPISPSQINAYILRLHARTPNNIPLPRQLLISRSHCLMCFFTQPIYVAQLIPLSVQFVYSISQPVSSSPLLVEVSEYSIDFLFDSEKFVAETIVSFAAVHQFLLVVTFFIWF